MAVTIGGITVIEMTGYEGLRMVDSVEEVSRPGVHGVAFHQIGKKSRRAQVSTVVDSTSATGSDTAYKALEKTFVTVVTPRGDTISNVFVHSVIVTAHKLVKAAGGVNGTNAAWLVTAQWDLQATATT